jgi:hypothetical protein
VSAQNPVARGNRLYQVAGLFETRLVDNAANLLHVWPSPLPVFQAYPLDDGTLLRAVIVSPFPVAGTHGGVQRVAYDDTVLWDYSYWGANYTAHHDICRMPNGNVLLTVWEGRTAAQAIAAGRNPALLNCPTFYPDSIVEVQPTGPTSGTFFWEWHLWDHLIQDFDPAKGNFGPVGSHAELVDINFPAEVLTTGDWNHMNGIDYDPDHDWLLVSARQQSEIWVIDHSTTTAEAASHVGGLRGAGGDLLYRWGNPQAWRAGTSIDQQLVLQHDPRFIRPGRPGAGNVTIFNNRWMPNQTAVFEISLPVNSGGHFMRNPNVAFGPSGPLWTFSSPNFYSSFVGSAERLPNGNTLVCSGGQGALLEADSAGNVVWLFAPPGLTLPIFQCQYVESTLWTKDSVLPAAAGGTVRIDQLGGAAIGNDIHFLLGSASGTTPGFQVQGVQVPLNIDYLFTYMVQNADAGMLQNTLGIADGFGMAQSQIVVPPGLIPPALVGFQLDFASLAVRPDLVFLECSRPVTVTIVP